MSALEIRRADREGIATMLDWAADEGWNPGIGDADAFHRGDPDGFLLGWLDGEPVASISFVRYPPAFAFLGCYIVSPSHRGQGHGLAMWRAAMDRRGARTVGLDGVPARQPDYRRSGFVLARRNIRFEGRGGGVRPPDLTSVQAVGLDAVADYDRTVFPADRRSFLEAWTALAGGTALAAVHDGAVVGYGVVRPCRTGWKMGPLFAETLPVAASLLDGLAATAGDAALFLDVPESNLAGVRLAEERGMRPSFETARMYLGPAPDEPIDRIFGITTFELG